jgi:hypothetical protein
LESSRCSEARDSEAVDECAGVGVELHGFSDDLRRLADMWTRSTGSRKIAATSSAGRDMRAALQPGGRISLSLSATCSSGLMTSLIVLVATRV